MNENERKLFDSMTANLSNEFEDPVGRSVRHAAAEVQSEINNTPNISMDAIDDGLMMLNNMLEQYNLMSEFVIVSGRLRVQDELRDEDDGTIPDEVLSELRTQFPELGELHRDDEGYFFSVSNMHVICGNVDRELDANDKCSIYLNVTSDMDAEDLSDTALYMPFDDMVTFAPAEASMDKIVWQLRNNYPDIASQIESIPSEGRTSEVMKALRQLDFVIDWDAYPYLSDADKFELINNIQDYITQHINLDTSFHSVNVDGVVYGYDYHGNLLESQDEHRVLNGHLGRINIAESYKDDEGRSHYEFELIVYQPALSHRSGYEIIHVPVNIIGIVRNHRSQRPLFDGPVARLGADVISKGKPEDSVQVTEQDEDETEVVYPARGNERYSVSDEGEALLKAVDERLKSLVTLCSKVSEMRFDTDAQAAPWLQGVEQAYSMFVDAARRRPCLYEVSGPGVMRMNLSSTREVEKAEEFADITLNLKINGLNHDEFAPILGHVAGMRSYKHSPDDAPDKVAFNFALSMYRNDKEPEQFTFQFEDSVGITLSSHETFLASINTSQTQISIPEADRLYAVDEVILKMTEQFEDDETLPWDINDLKLAVYNIPGELFDDFSDLDLLQRISAKAVTSPELLSRSRQIFRDLFYMRVTMMDGDIYDADGDKMENEQIAGAITDVITELSKSGRQEPMFEIREVTTNQFLYVPISSLRMMKV